MEGEWGEDSEGEEEHEKESIATGQLRGGQMGCADLSPTENQTRAETTDLTTSSETGISSPTHVKKLEKHR